MTVQSTKDFNAGTGLSATSKDALSKLVKAWESKNAQRAVRGAGLGLMAVSLAACGGSGEVAPPAPPAPPVDPVQRIALTSDLDLLGQDAPTNDHYIGGNNTLTSGDRIATTGTVTLDLSATNIDGQTIAASEVIIDASRGVSIEASDWTVSTVRIVDSTGNVSVLDLQSTATNLVIDDLVDPAATATFNFDAQALAGAADVVALSLKEVTSAVALTGGIIETLNITVTDVVGALSSLVSLIGEMNTINVLGGLAGADFTIGGILPSSVNKVDSTTFAGDLHIDMSNSGVIDVDFGAGADTLNLGDSFNSNDNIAGGLGADEVTMAFSTATVREGTMSGFETLNASFSAAATFDATNVTGLNTINLSTSSADADFNDMKSETTTLNIDGTVLDVEMDYAQVGNLTINLSAATAPVSVGDGIADDIQLLEVGTLAINANGGNSATILAMTDLHDDTTSLSITTDSVGGDLSMGQASTETAIDGGSSLVSVSIDAVHGDMNLYAVDHGFDAFIDEAGALQSYSVTATDADVVIGTIGMENPTSGGAADQEFAAELEHLEFSTDQDGTIDQGFIRADDESGANIESLTVTTNDKNTVDSNSSPFAFGAVGSGGSANIVIRGLDAHQIDNIALNALDRGNIVLDNQSYEVRTQTFTGNGNIFIHAGATVGITSPAYVQFAAADASAHTGTRTFHDGLGNDVFYGSTGNDTVVIDTVSGGADRYVDDGGADLIRLEDGARQTVSGSGGTAGDETVVILEDASDNTVQIGVASGSVAADADILINSTGTQTINELGASNLEIVVSGSNVLLGGDNEAEFVITGFGGSGAASDLIDFSGLGNLSAASGEQVVAGGTFALGSGGVDLDGIDVNDDTVVLITGTAGTASMVSGGSQTITDPTGSATNHTDVANYLEEGLDVAAGSTNVFIVQMTTISGGTADYRVYYFDDVDRDGTIDSDEIDYLGSISGIFTGSGGSDILDVTNNLTIV